MSENLIIQGPVPRSESIRAKLAALAWEDGLSAFVTNQVPFSFSGGRVLAAALSHLVRGLAEDSEDIVVMELGAGIGYLSNHCLDVLAEEHPETYRKSRFVVTDGQQEVVRDSAERGVLSDHGDRAEFAVADLRYPESILSEQPRLLILSYLLDAIPPLHLETHEDGVYEARIETSIPRDAFIHDGSVWPPRILGSADIRELLRGEAGALTTVLARRVVSLIEESWSWMPLPETDLTKERLNSRRSVVLSLCEILGRLPEESAIVITDFGYLKWEATEPNELMTEYGLCAFWAVAFDEVISIVQGAGYEAMLNPGREGETHTLLIYKGDRIDRMRAAFTAGFTGMNSDRPHEALYTLEEDASLEDIRSTVDEIEATMPDADMTSYGNLSRLAHLLLKHGDIERAVPYAQKCIALYPEVAAPELAILGSVAVKQGEMDVAEMFFLQAIDLAPGFANGYLGMSEVHRARQDWRIYLGTLKDLMAKTDCDVVDVMERLAKTLADAELSDVAEEAKLWLISSQ